MVAKYLSIAIVRYRPTDNIKDRCKTSPKNRIMIRYRYEHSDNRIEDIWWPFEMVTHTPLPYRYFEVKQVQPSPIGLRVRAKSKKEK